MNTYGLKKIELELKKFASLNFEQPSECRDLEQIMFYVRELSLEIEELETRFDYAPPWIYSLLAQYNAARKKMLPLEFMKAYQ
jgi:hypothetical protein